MLFRFGPIHRAAGWLLTIFGLLVLVLGGQGYLTGAAVQPGWVVGGLIAIVAGTALIRWARRSRPG